MQEVKNIKHLINDYNQICNLIVNAFCEKQNLNFDYWVADEIGGIADINGYFFNLSDIIIDLKNDTPKGAILEWQDQVLEANLFKEPGQTEFINYRSWLMGARYLAK